MKSYKDVIDKYVKESIKDLIFDLSKNPLLHFAEKSLQVRLAAKLLKCQELSEPIQTSLYERYRKDMEKLNPDKSHLDNALSVPPLQMEYGVKEISNGRIDIAILDPKDIKFINSWQFEKDGEFLNPIIGIEIGTEKAGMPDMCKHLENDANKLSNSKIGYILNVIRNTNVCGKQTKDYKNKELQLGKFKNCLKTVSSSPKYAKIKCIGLIIHIAYQDIEFFDINNEWKTFKYPYDGFTDAVNNKL